MQAPAVTATLTLSRAGQSDRCVGSLSLKGADGKPIAAAIAKVQWAGAAAPATISTSPKVPGRLFSTSSSQNAAAGCELQLLEVTVAGEQQHLSAELCWRLVHRHWRWRFLHGHGSLHGTGAHKSRNPFSKHSRQQLAPITH
jgi:hypothetical protein